MKRESETCEGAVFSFQRSVVSGALSWWGLRSQRRGIGEQFGQRGPRELLDPGGRYDEQPRAGPTDHSLFQSIDSPFDPRPPVLIDVQPRYVDRGQ